MARSKTGIVKHSENPFLSGAQYNTRKKKITVSAGKAIIDMGTGEIEDTAEIVQVLHVDNEEFVKIYTRNLKQIFNLTPSTQKLFQVVLSQLQKVSNTDKIMLNYGIAEDYFTTSSQDVMSRSSFHRSIKELIEKKFIAESVFTGLYFINPNLFFNGDRVRFVQEVRRKESDKKYEKNVKALVGAAAPDQASLFGPDEADSETE